MRAPAVKISVRHSASDPWDALESVRDLLEGLVEVTRSGPTAPIELLALGVSKASGVAFVADRLGVSSHDTLAIGDMPNDLPMLRWAGRSAAPANAHPDVLGAVDQVLSDCDEDGVAQLLETLTRGETNGVVSHRSGYVEPYLNLSRIIDKSIYWLENRDMTNAWDNWERLRQDPDADPIEVLRAISSFQKYFAAIEKEAVKVARSQNRTWQEIGAALGRSRQALWQRAASRASDSKKADWEALGRQLEESWATSAEVRHNIGMAPP